MMTLSERISLEYMGDRWGDDQQVPESEDRCFYKSVGISPDWPPHSDLALSLYFIKTTKRENSRKLRMEMCFKRYGYRADSADTNK